MRVLASVDLVTWATGIGGVAVAAATLILGYLHNRRTDDTTEITAAVANFEKFTKVVQDDNGQLRDRVKVLDDWVGKLEGDLKDLREEVQRCEDSKEEMRRTHDTEMRTMSRRLLAVERRQRPDGADRD